VRRRFALLAAPALALASATPALGADATVKGLDSLVWDKPAVTINAGERVTWTFDGTVQPHNVLASSANWTFRSELGPPPAPPVSRTFATPGVYDYVCEVHSTTMIGRVTGNSETGAPPPPPPPPPLSQQAFPTDGRVSANAFEVGGLDTEDPALRGIAVRRTGAKARISFRVDEQSRVTVRLSRGGKRVKTKHANTARRGSVTVKKLKAGRYKATIVARDLAGNASRTRTASFTVS
jgi:plastocyanin